MRKLLTGSILPVLLSSTLFLASPLFGQKVDKEGKAWLDSCTDTATLNVTGAWKAPQWGTLTLSEGDDNRTVTGHGDGWDISGVVSGNSVCLLFSYKGRVHYSAKLTADASGALAGTYAKGMLGRKLKTVPMRLVK